MTDMLPEIVEDLTEDEMVKIRAGIERGFEAVAAGKVRSAEGYKADVLERRAERRDADQSRGKTTVA